MNILYPQVLILLLGVLWLYKKDSKLIYISLSLMILALSRPVLIDQNSDETIKAKELIIALDVSYSMRADDLKPSRLSIAKQLIEQTLDKNKIDKFSLFAFTTNPLILSPATTDHKLLASAFNSLKVENILTHGTNLESLFNRISKLQIPQKNLLLFSDGGDSFDTKTLLSICKKNNIHIFAICTATKRGSTLTDRYGKNIKDSRGSLVITRINPQLEELAVKSGGKFFTYDNFDQSLDFIEQKEFSKIQKRGFIELFWLPIILAIVLFWISFAKIPKKVLALIPFLTLNLDASVLDWHYINQANKSYNNGSYKEAIANFAKIEYKTMQSQLNLANSHYQLGSFKSAKSIYKNLKSTNPKTKQLILYKLGNCASSLKEYKSAKRYYQQALILGENKDILHNLKLITPKIDKSRRDFAAFQTKDKQKKETPQGSGKKDNKKKGNNNAQAANSSMKRPLGYKAYELINRGYIDEKKPW